MLISVLVVRDVDRRSRLLSYFKVLFRMISLPSYHQNISYSYHIYKQKHQQSLIFKETKNLNQYLKERAWTINSNIITDAEKGKQNPLAREGARGGSLRRQILPGRRSSGDPVDAPENFHSDVNGILIERRMWKELFVCNNSVWSFFAWRQSLHDDLDNTKSQGRKMSYLTH